MIIRPCWKNIWRKNDNSGTDL